MMRETDIGPQSVIQDLSDAQVFASEISLAVQFPGTPIDFEKLSREIEPEGAAILRTDRAGVQVLVSVPLPEDGYHAHLTLERDAAADIGDTTEIVMRYDLYPGQLTSDDRFADPDATLDVFTRHLPALATELRGIASGSFRFPLERWGDVLGLPLSLPPATPLPGLPEVAGMDLSFRDVSAEQPILRAFVTTYDQLGWASVRIMQRFEGRVSGDVGLEVLRQTYKYSKRFVREKEGGS